MNALVGLRPFLFTMQELNQIIDAMTGRNRDISFPTKNLLSTGSTTVNLALSGRACGGLAKGFYYRFCGGSNTGKTFLGLTTLAEACANPEFKDYRIIHDDVEGGALMEKDSFFGSAFANRVEPPSAKGSSETIEEFYDNWTVLNKSGVPYVYFLDSFDALSSEAEIEKSEKQATARRKGTKAAGSMSDGKAKINSQNLRRQVMAMQKTGSIFVGISQEREQMGSFMFMGGKTTAGGRALKFYCTCEVWFAHKESLYKTVNKIKEQVGILVQAKVKKNRQRGWSRIVDFPIYHSLGIDDIESCFDFLRRKNQLSKLPKSLRTKKKADLIKVVESKNWEPQLRQCVEKAWIEIESKCSLDRKPRYE